MQQGQRMQLQEPVAAATQLSHQQKQKPGKVVVVAEVKPAEPSLLEATLYKLIKAPKKLIGAVAGIIIGKLKSVSAKGLIKTALLAGLVTVVATVAAVGILSVGGLVAAVTGICATVLHFKSFLGVGGEGGVAGRTAESQIDEISQFVLGAFDKYGEKN